jgi:hypothetical protein
MNIIDIVERFQMHHALQEEREFKNSHSRAKKCGYRRSHPHATQNGRHRMMAGIVWSRGWAK